MKFYMWKGGRTKKLTAKAITLQMINEIFVVEIWIVVTKKLIA